MLRLPWIICTILLCPGAPHASTANPAGIDWQPLDGFAVARTETTVGQYRRHALAMSITTQAERAGGGSVYENGWTVKPGWTWREPYGRKAADDEPAVHLTHGEAQAFCRWAGGRLPDDREWRTAAYMEQRRSPAAPFERGRSYPFPSGNSPQGAICLGDCGEAARRLAVDHGAPLLRGAGHAPAGRSRPGVNGLFDMGGNVWEWVDDPPSNDPAAERLTRGGSWWYGADSMRAEHRQTKPGTTSVVYIGFRCVR